MKLIAGLLIFIPLALFVGFFAVENQTPVSVRVWPFRDTPELWLSVLILGPLAAGLILGMVIGWISGGRWRRRARRAERQVRSMERRFAETAEEHGAAPPPPAPAASAGALPGPQRRAARVALVDD